jgi:ABC-type antimicrobial peptide transport system permease subunit
MLFIAAVSGCISGYLLSKMMMASIWEVFTDVTVFTFLVPLILIFFTAIITIGWKVYSAASRNPTESLRYE